MHTSDVHNYPLEQLVCTVDVVLVGQNVIQATTTTTTKSKTYGSF